jgi:hypothetical protein
VAAWRLHPWEWRVLVETAVVAPFVEVQLRRGPLADLVAWSADGVRGAAPGTWPSPRVERLSRLVAHAYDRLPMPSTCLRRSLVVARLLTRRGVAAQVKLGVRRSGVDLQAHAWVEANGQVVGEGDEGFSSLFPDTP